MSSGQLWAINTLGGYWSTPKLSGTFRGVLQPLVRFRQFCDAMDAEQQGQQKGDTFMWDVYSDPVDEGGVLTETNTIPSSNLTITQGTLSLVEMGLEVPYSGKLDRTSEAPVKKIISKSLKNNARRALDRQAKAQFDATPLHIVPTGGTSTSAVTLTTNGTATLTNNVALGKGHIKDVVNLMKEREIPAFSEDDYMCLARPTTYSTLMDDLESVHQYVPEGFRMIIRGEIGRYRGMRFVEQTNSANAGWANGLSDEAFFFGEDTVSEAINCPEEIRGKIAGDYGRAKGVAWYYYGGFGLVHTVAAQARVLKWNSAG